jgi:rare lipoprotein A
MKKILSIGLTSSLLVTSFGTIVFLFGSLEGSIASNPDSSTSNAPSVETFEEGDRRQIAKTVPADLPSSGAVATIHPYRWQGKLAVILRVRNIPVLTFLGATQDLTASKEPVNAAHPIEDPVLRAKTVAQRLNQLAQDTNFDADQIKAIWDSKTQSYAIKVGTETLTLIDSATILPDSTKNPGIDTLQATNRLRRLMGDAAPLQAIAGAPNRRGVNPVQSLRAAVKAIRNGMASWYGPGFHGRQTANGERYNQHGLTAAHKTLPFGTRVRVTNLHNGQSVVVRINDRGPFVRGRVIDLSAGAARTIGVISSGVAPVQLEVLGR